MSKATNKIVENSIIDHGLTESGRVLNSEESLRRFLVQTRDQIELDKSHFMEEGLSDFFSLYESGHAIISAIETSDTHPLLDNSFAFISASAAIYLLNSINTQRAGKEVEYKKALKMFLELEADKNKNNHLINEETDSKTKYRLKTEAKDFAIINLDQKIKHSGLQFVNLPSNTSKFRRSEFISIAHSKNIGNHLKLSAIKKVSDFLNKPSFEKIEVSAEALSHLGYKYEKSLDFFLHVFSEYARNTVPSRIRRIGSHTDEGLFIESSELSSDIKKFKTSKKMLSLSKKFSSDESISHIVTKKDLRRIQPNHIPHISSDWEEKEKDDIILIMKDHETHLNNAKRARRSLYLQVAFEVAQVGTTINKGIHGDLGSINLNVFSFFAAMGPLAGFAKELKSERAKANSKKSLKAEKIAQVMGIDYESLDYDI